MSVHYMSKPINKITKRPATIQIIRFPALSKMLGISRSTLFRWMRDGEFPRNFNMGANSVAWLYSDIESWIQSRSKEELLTEEDN